MVLILGTNVELLTRRIGLFKKGQRERGNLPANEVSSVQEEIQEQPMKPDEIVDIIREDQSRLDRTIADIDEQKSRKSSSADRPRDQKISRWGSTSTAKDKAGG